jgi:hypothetical protein
MGSLLNRDKSVAGQVLIGIRRMRGRRKGRDKVSSNMKKARG